ncbi:MULTISPECIES: inorganic phosphate transporter [Thermodesulfovibrio]|uniref:Sodium/phosphate symporter n=1 Tax=Thermodesulfovibrio yellowstonii (strain ATCC 51303 / DSM 11347 / YP87) TaxID=289376 RepID=B5YHL3_THEYD|nr:MULTISPECIES: inorganic phosphate transporter [Thermodesulfovibrio]ACI22031.1 sodium/phosphate symporter [Thermodesulfovibrio yellowstonii DSM 11347]
METFYIVGMIIAGLFFGWTIGSHYTGAVMGTAYGAKIFDIRTATLIMAVCALLGATLQSHEVIKTVGAGIIPIEYLTPFRAMIMMLNAALVTAVNTWLKLPISTAQLACFSIVGVGLAIDAPVAWEKTMLPLAITWVGTPLVGCLLGFIFTKTVGAVKKAEKIKRAVLILACCYASFTLGANNSGLAVSVLYGSGTVKSLLLAGFIGGVVVAIGALTWGRPLLEKVGLHIVQLEINSAIGAQFGQATTAYIAALLGYPTSMNQAIVGAIGGAGLARGVKYIQLKVVKEIVINWFVSLIVSGFTAYFLYKIFSWLLGAK